MKKSNSAQQPTKTLFDFGVSLNEEEQKRKLIKKFIKNLKTPSPLPTKK